MAKIFISHTSSDKTWAEWIAWTLEEAGHTAHLDAWEIEGGENIMNWMMQKFEDSHYVLCVCSPAYFEEDREYSAMERLAALWNDPVSKKTRARFVVVERCALPQLIQPIKRLHLYDLSRDEAREQLVEHFEKVQRVIDKLLRGCARWERPIVKRASIQPS